MTTQATVTLFILALLNLALQLPAYRDRSVAIVAFFFGNMISMAMAVVIIKDILASRP